MGGEEIMGSPVEVASLQNGGPLAVALAAPGGGAPSDTYMPGMEHELQISRSSPQEHAGAFLLHVSEGTLSSALRGAVFNCDGGMAAWSSANSAKVTWRAPAAGSGDAVITVATAMYKGPVGLQNITVREASGAVTP